VDSPSGGAADLTTGGTIRRENSVFNVATHAGAGGRVEQSDRHQLGDGLDPRSCSGRRDVGLDSWQLDVSKWPQTCGFGRGRCTGP